MSIPEQPVPVPATAPAFPLPPSGGSLPVGFGGENVDRPGYRLVWRAGVWSGHPNAVAEARLLCAVGCEVSLTQDGPRVAARADDPLVAAAVIARVLRHQVRWHGTVPAAAAT